MSLDSLCEPVHQGYIVLVYGWRCRLWNFCVLGQDILFYYKEVSFVWRSKMYYSYENKPVKRVDVSFIRGFTAYPYHGCMLVG